jgi:hypothetical protein
VPEGCWIQGHLKIQSVLHRALLCHCSLQETQERVGVNISAIGGTRFKLMTSVKQFHVCANADKHARMKAVFAYYNHGDLHALDPFPGGSEKGT